MTEKQLKDRYGNREVFIIPYHIASKIKNGFTRKKHHISVYDDYAFDGKYVLKYEAMTNQGVKQIKPFLIIKDESNTLFYIHEHKDSEKLTLGFMDNISKEDGVMSPILRAMARIMQDQLIIDPVDKAEHIGILKDTVYEPESIVYPFIIKGKKNAIKCLDDNANTQWMSKEELIENFYKFDPFSVYLINYLLEKPDF